MVLLILSILAGPSAATPVSGAVRTGRAVTLTGVYREVHGETRLSEETLYFLEVGGEDGDSYRLKVGKKTHVHSGA
jgi:hypothetical protein